MQNTKTKDPGGGREQKPELVPPDGGWGWMVVFAFALCNVIAVPILQSFGLLFKGTFEQLNISGTDASVIINVNASFGMILGLFTGYLLRSYGYRKIALIGAIINSVGVILTSQANSFAYFLITYGIISSVGFNLLASALGLAINTYFKERRGKAVGFGTTAMGLGPVFMPLVISKLMDVYGVQGTALILGALSLHSVIGALLLQPVKWHMVPKKHDPEAVVDEEEEDDEVDEKGLEKRLSCHADDCGFRRNRTITTSSSIDHDIDSQSVYGFETPLPEHRKSRRRSSSSFRRSTLHIEDARLTSLWASSLSIDSVNLGSSVRIFDERAYQQLREDYMERGKDLRNNREETKSANIAVSNGTDVKKKNYEHHECKESKFKSDDAEKEDEETQKPTFWKRVGHSIVNFFDLRLFKDPIYVNLMLGMSLAICGELNFSLLTPFILNDRGFDTERTALIMSVIGGLDIVFRFIVPFFSDHYKIHPRNMYIIALLMLVSSRTAMIFSSDFNSMMAVAVALGVAKGVRTVYMTIVIPAYVPIERLAAASGIQMVTNGILLMAFGPLIGGIRDLSGSYDWCIAFINLLTVTTLTMWIVEIIIMKIRQRRQAAVT